MKRSLFLVALACAIGISCSYNGVSDSPVLDDSLAMEAGSADWKGVYRNGEGSVEQLIEVSVSGDEMLFCYSIVDDAGGCCYSLSGRAILKVGDLEWDDDTAGIAYAVDEYVYDSVCYMAIRIEADSHSLARIVTDDEKVLRLVGEEAATMALVE